MDCEEKICELCGGDRCILFWFGDIGYMCSSCAAKFKLIKSETGQIFDVININDIELTNKLSKIRDENVKKRIVEQI
jgi:hypothetical protein